MFMVLSRNSRQKLVGVGHETKTGISDDNRKCFIHINFEDMTSGAEMGEMLTLQTNEWRT